MKKKRNSKGFKMFPDFKTSLRIIEIILSIIAVYYCVNTGVYLLFLLPLIVMWAMEAEGVEFFNVLYSEEMQRTDVSYFTTRDLLDSTIMLLVVGILIFAILKLRKAQNKLTQTT